MGTKRLSRTATVRTARPPSCDGAFGRASTARALGAMALIAASWCAPVGAATTGPAFLTSFVRVKAALEHAGLGPAAMPLADFNGDGLLDLTLSGGPGGTPGVAINATPFGALGAAFTVFHPLPGRSGNHVFAADINGDGLPDLVFDNPNYVFSVQINATRRGESDVNFDEPQSLPVFDIGAQLVALVDVDGDGRPDMLASTHDGSFVVLRNLTALGSSTIAFGAPELAIASAPNLSFTTAADLDGDGKPELVFLDSSTHGVVIAQNTAQDGTLAFSLHAELANRCIGFARIADVNGDGKPDLVAGGTCGDQVVYVALNETPAGAHAIAWAAAQQVADTGACGPAVAEIGDLDGDGKPDLVIASSGDSGLAQNPPGCFGGVIVLYDTTTAGSTSVSFTPPAIAPGAFLRGVAIGDVNGDGKPDIIASDGFSGSSGTRVARVFINTHGAQTVDLDQFGVTGSWFNPSTPGQGFEIEVDPDVQPDTANVFAGWVTYDPQGARQWLTLNGLAGGSQPYADLAIYQNRYDDPDSPSVSIPRGQATLALSDCTTAWLTYALDDGGHGVIGLKRLTPNVTCTTDGQSNSATHQYGLSGNWFDPATSGQGFTFDVSPTLQLVFGAWYTYKADSQQATGETQDWYTVQSTAPVADFHSIHDLAIVETDGGAFDQPSSTVSTKVGSAEILVQDCQHMTLSYQFTAGAQQGKGGVLHLLRAAPVPYGCAL